MKRIATAVTGVMLAALLTACGPATDDDNEYYGVCVDPTTQIRLDDDACEDDDSGIWYYLAVAHAIPRVGAVASGGTKARPAGSVKFGAPRNGRAVAPAPRQGSVRRAPSQNRRNSGGYRGGFSGGRRR